jgi:1-acyl-sn-glycerol-3-phosphate acyltransferase
VIPALLAGFARAIAGGTVRWKEPLTDVRQRIFFGNHTSHLDFILIWSSLPVRLRGRARPVAASDYWESGAIRRYLAHGVFNAVLIDRGGGGREAVARMVEGLGDDHSLILFPEGTRGSGERVQEFRSGLYHLCCERPDVELVPVHLENLNRALPKGEFIPVPVISRIAFGSPMKLEEGEAKEAFLERARRAVEQLRTE